VRKGDNASKSSKLRVGWLSHMDESMSLIVSGIVFGGVVIVFMLWKRAKYWMVPKNMPQPFFGVYQFPTYILKYFYAQRFQPIMPKYNVCGELRSSIIS